jgi:hypothetical protein
VRENDLNGLVDQMRGIARRQPAVFAGASVAAGFALARMARIAMEDGAGTRPAPGGRYPEPTDTTQTTEGPGVSPSRTYPGTAYDE